MTWTSSLFDGKQVLVAGGTSGIGAATATRSLTWARTSSRSGCRQERGTPARPTTCGCRRVISPTPSFVESLVDSFASLDV